MLPSHSNSHDAVIRAYDVAGGVIETHEHKGDFKEWQSFFIALDVCSLVTFIAGLRERRKPMKSRAAQ